MKTITFTKDMNWVLALLLVKELEGKTLSIATNIPEDPNWMQITFDKISDLERVKEFLTKYNIEFQQS